MRKHRTGSRKLLPSQRNSERVAQKIRGTFQAHFRRRGRTFFEHGHWWIEIPSTGAQYSVHDTGRDFGFEQVTQGDDE